VEDRLAVLEAQLRRMRALGAALAAGFLLIVVWRLLPGETVLGARRFVLIGERGMERGALELAADGSTQVRLNDERGKSRASLFVRRDGDVCLRLTDVAGNNRTQMWLGGDGVPHLQMSDARGHVAADLGVAPDGAASLGLARGAGGGWTRLP
jgi:hypothetical protein